MRTLADIATEMRQIQRKAYDAHMDASDPYLPDWERDFDEESYDKAYSELHREFEQLLGIKDLDDFGTSTDVILGMLHKSLELKQLRSNYWELQEHIEYGDDDATKSIETLSELLLELEEY